MMNKKASSVFEATVAAAGMFLFAIFVHTRLPLRILSFVGLALTFLTLLYGLKTSPSPAVTLGVARFSKRTAGYTTFGSFFGFALGVAHRWGYGMAILPTTFRRFAGIAALIGATEEILYRGYIQGRARPLGSLMTVVFASFCHTLYKCSLFVFPNQPVELNIGFLAAGTFAVGLILGGFRERSKSVWPPVIAHVLFDIVVYGEYGSAPWWVWL